MKSIIKSDKFFKTLVFIVYFLVFLISCSDVEDSGTTTTTITTTTSTGELISSTTTTSTTTTNDPNPGDTTTTTTTINNITGSTTTTTTVNGVVVSTSTTTTTQDGSTTTTTTDQNGNTSTTTTPPQGGEGTGTTQPPNNNLSLELKVEKSGFSPQNFTITASTDVTNLYLTIPSNTIFNVPYDITPDKKIKPTVTKDEGIGNSNKNNIVITFESKYNEVEYFYMIKPIEDAIKSKYPSKNISTTISNGQTVRFHFNTSLQDINENTLELRAPSTNIDRLIGYGVKLVDSEKQSIVEANPDKLNINKNVTFSGELYNFANSTFAVLYPQLIKAGQATKITLKGGKINTKDLTVYSFDCYATDFFDASDKVGCFTTTDKNLLPTIKYYSGTPETNDPINIVANEIPNGEKYFSTDKMYKLYKQYEGNYGRLALTSTNGAAFLNNGLGGTPDYKNVDPETWAKTTNKKAATDATADAAVVTQMAKDGFQYFANWTINGNIKDPTNETTIIGYNLHFTGTDLSKLTFETLEDRVVEFDKAVPSIAVVGGYAKINGIQNSVNSKIVSISNTVQGVLIDISALNNNDKSNFETLKGAYDRGYSDSASLYHKDPKILKYLTQTNNLNSGSIFSYYNSKIKRTPNQSGSTYNCGSVQYLPQWANKPTMYEALLTNIDFVDSDGTINSNFLDAAAKGALKLELTFDDITNNYSGNIFDSTFFSPP